MVAIRYRRILISVSLLSALLVSGCIIKPTPFTPPEMEAQVTADLKEIFNSREALSSALTLDEAIRQTLAHNLDVRLKLMEDALSLKQLEVVSYEMLPKLVSSAGYSSRNNENASTSVSVTKGSVSLEPSTSQEKQNYSTDLSLSWNILDFGVSYFQARQQADRALIMKERRRKVVHAIVQQARQAYWLAYGAQQLEPRFRSLLREVNDALNSVDRIEQEKLRPPLEILTYRKALLETLRQIEAFRDDLAQATPRLAALMNLPVGGNPALVRDQPLTVPDLRDPLATLEDTALRFRPELLEVRLQERIDVVETKKAIARMLPGINLSFGFNYDSNTYLYNSDWVQGSVRSVWNLMSLLTGPAQYKLAKSQAGVTKMTRLALSVAVLTQTHIAYLDFFSKKRQYERADQLREIDSRIAAVTRSAAESGAQNRLSEIKADTELLMADYRRYQSFAALQNAYGQVLMSVGIDPLESSRQPAQGELSMTGVTP